MALPWNAYGPWLKARHGAPVHRICIDAGFTCPNRDGSKGRGGCTYCNVDSFVPAAVRRIPSIAEQVRLGAERIRRRHGDGVRFILYFQANTNTYAPVHVLRARYDEALAAAPAGTVELIVGTRPDCVGEDVLSLLASYRDRIPVTVELGLESMHDETLVRVNRGHTHAEFGDAVSRISKHPLELGLHAIFGFPWEAGSDSSETARLINRGPARFLKIHQLHVVHGSAMAAEYRSQPFPLYSLEAWCEFLAGFLPRLRGDLVIQRLVASAPSRHLVAPAWAAQPALALAKITEYLDRLGVKQGSHPDL